MPLQFKNLSESVIKDSKGVQKGLEGLVKTAGQADKAFAKMSATQQSALAISNKFKATVKSLSKSLSQLKAIGSKATKSLDGIGRVSTTAATSMDSLSASFKDIGKTTKGAQVKITHLVKALDGISDKEVNIDLVLPDKGDMKKLAKQLKEQLKAEAFLKKQEDKRHTTVDKLTKAEDLHRKSSIKTTKENKKQADTQKKNGVDKLIKNQLRKAEDMLEVLKAKYKDVADAEPVVKIQVEIAKLEAFDKFVDRMDDAGKAAVKAKVETSGLNTVINEMASSNEVLAVRLQNASNAALEEAASASKLGREMGKAEKFIDLVKNRFAEGEKEAKSFADGLGVANGVLIGAGVASVYLAKKGSELIGSFTNSRISLAKYRQETLLAAKETIGFSKTGLENLRKSLSLTREQAKAYFAVVHEGTNQLGMAPAQIEAVSKALRDTFGGDPTDRLREYVGLLKEIPTLDTDLSVSASMDDQSAAIFDLAQKGKIETTIDLQSAGLLGAGKGIEFETKDKSIIQAQQKVESRVQAINDTLLNYYQPWNTQFSAIADYSFKTLSALGGGIAVLGTLKAFMVRDASKTIHGISRVDPSVKEVKASVDALGIRMGRTSGLRLKDRSGIRPPPLPGSAPVKASDVIRKINGQPPPLPTKAVEGATKGLTALEQSAAAASGGIWTSAKTMLSSTKTWVKGLSFTAKAGVGVGLVMEAAGIAADYLSDSLDESGHDIAAAGTKAGGALLKVGAAALTGAAIGSVFPVIGTAIGAAAGAIVGFIANMDDMGQSMKRWGKGLSESKKKVSGKEVSEFGPTARAFGKVIGAAGTALEHLWNATKSVGKGLWEAAKFVAYWGSGVGEMVETFKAIDNAIDPERAKAFKEAGVSAGLLNQKFKELSDASKTFEKDSEEYIKGVMQSGLALEKEMSILKKTFESGKFALVDFQASLAQIDISTLSDIGGSAESFSRAVDASAAAVTKRFDMTTNALQESRNRITKDAKLQGDQRAKALDLLHQREMEAVRQFVEGMRKAVDSLFKSPQIIQAGLKREMTKVPIDLGLEIGSLKADDLFKGFDSQMKSLEATRDEYAKAGEKAEQDIGNIRLKLAAANKKAVSDLSEEEKKAFSAKGIIKETKDGYQFQKEAAIAYFDDLGKAMDGQKAEMDKYAKSFEIGGVDKLVMSLAQVDARAENAAKGLESAQRKRDSLDAASQTEKYTAAVNAVKLAKEETEAAEKARIEVSSQMDKISSEIASELKLDPKDIKEAFDVVATELKKGGKLEAKDVKGSPEEVQKVLKVQDAVIKRMKDGGENFKKMSPILKEWGKNADARALLRPVIDNMDAETSILETRLDIMKKNTDLQKQVAEEITKVTRISETDEVRDVERQLRALQDVQAEAGMLSDPTDAVVKSLQKQTDLFSEQMEQTEKSYNRLKGVAKIRAGELAEAEKAEAFALKAVKAGDKASSARYEEAKKTADIARNLLRMTQNGMESLNKQRAELAKTFPKIGAGIAQVIEEFNESLSGQEITSRIGLADALMELSDFGDNFAGTIKEAREIGIKAAKDEYEAKKKNIDKGLEAEQKALDARAKQAGKIGGSGEADRVRREGQMIIDAKKRAQYAEAETKMKKKVVELAEQEASKKIGIVDATQSALESEIEVAAMRGNHLSVLVDKQREILGYEKQRVDAIKEQYEISLRENSDSMKTQLLGLQLRKAEADLQKKSLGYTRDVMERMLGMALGGIRTSVGARRQRGTDIALMGIEATRVKTRAGTYTGAGPEGVKPYWQRLAEYKTGAGTMGASRLPPEKAMGAALRGTGMVDSTKNTAKATQTIAKDGHTKGSIYTHDVTTESLLSSILYVAEEMAVGILDNKAITGGGTGARGILDAGIKKIMQESARTANKTEEVADSTKSIAEGQNEVVSSSESSVVNEEVSNKVQKKQFTMQKQEMVIKKREVKAEKTFQNKVGKSADTTSAFAGPKATKKLGEMGMTSLAGSKATKKLGEMGMTSLTGSKATKKLGEDSAMQGIYQRNLVKQQEKEAKSAKIDMASKGKGQDRTWAEMMSGSVTEASNEMSAQQVAMTGQDTMAIAQRSRAMTAVGGASNAAFAPTGGVKGALGVTGGATAAGGGGMAEAPTMKVEGRMTVHFDNTAFKDQIVKVVGEVIKTPYIAKSIQSVVYNG